MAQLYKIEKPHTPVEKKTRTVVDTILVTPELLATWKSPPFQRPVRQNDKVLALAEKLKTDGGVWPGIITLGILNGVTYVIDGLHRKESFLISGLKEGYVDIRIHYCESLAQMGEEFVELNSKLVQMRPDDILRGLEPSITGLRKVRAACPFVGYDYIRRNAERSPILSMAVAIRAWRGSAADAPGPNIGGMSAGTLAQTMSDSDYDKLIEFLQLAYNGFGRDPQYGRLWSALNLGLCMWLYRRIVMTPDEDPRKRVRPITKDHFKKGLMSVSAHSDYVDWLLGRSYGERDRSPAYNRIKTIFAERLKQETGEKPILPQPAWAHS